MSHWINYSIERHVLAVLDVAQANSAHHFFGRPFLTAYQLAIGVHEREPRLPAAMSNDLGGVGVERTRSFARYLANELSKRIKADSAFPVEGRYLSAVYQQSLEYSVGGTTITSSKQDEVSMFRLRH